MPHDQTKLDLYLSQRTALLDYATPIVGDRMRAEDVVQEAWLRFASADPDRSGKSGIIQPAAYLFRIVRNLAIDLSRKLTHESPHPAGDVAVLEELPSDRADPEQEVTGRHDLQLVAAALDRLPPRTRRAFDLHRFEGKTYAEIGEILGISQGRAYGLVREAVARCAAALLEKPTP